MKDYIKYKALTLLAVGVFLILVRLYTMWDMWVVVGSLVIVKAVVMFFFPCKKKK